MMGTPAQLRAASGPQPVVAAGSGPIRTGATVVPQSRAAAPSLPPGRPSDPIDDLFADGPSADTSGPIRTGDTVAPPVARKRSTAPALVHRGVIPPSTSAADLRVTGMDERADTDVDLPSSTSPEPPPSRDVATADTQIFADSAEPVTRHGRATRALHRDESAGTHILGTENLAAPGNESPKIKLTPGRQIPGTRWRIDRWLGEGGMGVVYEASHVDIERKSALKILRFDLSQQARMVQVFRDEARAASRLGSPHIVEIFDFGELSDGRLFFSMELLKGRDLVPENEGETMAPARLIGLLRQVCKGLRVAHDAGVVHRDVKPENVIVVPHEGRPDFVKLVDFGISSMLAAGQQAGGGGIAGTPHYMAPEQIIGDRFDGRLDVYAVGCTAYELLVGRPPFDADEVDKILQMHLHDLPVAPRTVRPDLQIPAALEAVILRCLAKDPANRFPNMDELEAALCEAQIAAGLTTPWDDLPVPTGIDPERRAKIVQQMPSARVERPARSLVWPIVAGVSTLAAAGLAAILLVGGPTDEDKSIVDAITTEARDAAVRGDWTMPPPGEPDTITALRKVLELEGLEGSADALGDDRASDLREEFATALDRYGDRAWDAGAKRQAREFYLWALAFDENDERALERVDVPPAWIADFRARAEAGDFSENELLMGRLAALDTIEDTVRKEEESAKMADAIAQNDMVAPLVMADASDPMAKVVLEKTRERAARRGEGIDDRPAKRPVDDPPDEPIDDPPEIVDDPAAIDAETAETADAAGDKQSKATKRRRKADPDALIGKAERDPAKASELAQQGEAAYRAGQRSQAASLFNQAIAYDRSNATALMGLSDIYFDTGKNQKAVVYAERAVKASPGNQSYWLKLGDAYYKVLRYKDALTQYEHAKKLGSSKADARIAKVKDKVGG
jgi:tetratricopeptide (TPR) repeat protein